jgi:hypothetical protein
MRVQIELRITSNPYLCASFNLIHHLTNSLNFDCPLRQRPLKLTGSKSGGPTLGSVGGVETRVGCLVVFEAGANKCFDR